jgi:hypothetical protein
MRCAICDASDVGLSNYRPDGRFHAKDFHLVADKYLCSECYDGYEDVMTDFYDDDLAIEEIDDAFDFEQEE